MTKLVNGTGGRSKSTDNEDSKRKGRIARTRRGELDKLRQGGQDTTQRTNFPISDYIKTLNKKTKENKADERSSESKENVEEKKEP